MNHSINFNELLGKKVKIKTPATIANIVCGFDVLGLCLTNPFDEMEISITETPGINIATLSGEKLPSNPVENTAGVPLLEIVKRLNLPFGFDVKIFKNIKPGSGLGSSAASAAGAVYAANFLLGNIFSKQEMTDLAMLGEAVASGARHADNIAPGIYGGMTLVRSITPLDVVSLSYPSLFVSVLHPQIEVKTSIARQLIPKEMSTKAAIQQWANVGALVAGLHQSDYALISRSLTDLIAEPVRKHLIPGFDEVKHASLAAGALGGGIAGSGPTIFMLSKDEHTAKKVEAAMIAAYSYFGADFLSYVSPINKYGIETID